MHRLIHFIRALGIDVQCPNCRFWYDPAYGHACTPCCTDRP